jgi:DNA-binding NtrC family response regulator
MQVLLSYSWPGNVRELENAIERACVTSRDPVIQVENLPAELSAPPKPVSRAPIDLKRPLADYLREAVAQIERDYITKALEETRGHVGKCATYCGLSRRSVSIKMNEYGIDKSAYKGGGLADEPDE